MSAPKPRNCYSNTDDGGKPPTRLEATGQARPTRANLAAPNQVTAPTSNATVAHAEPTLTPKPPKTPPKRREETRAYHHPRKWSNSSQRPAGERNKPHQQARCPMTRRDYLAGVATYGRSEEHTSELQSRGHLVCRLLLEKKKRGTQAALLRAKVGSRGGPGRILLLPCSSGRAVWSCYFHLTRPRPRPWLGIERAERGRDI